MDLLRPLRGGWAAAAAAATDPAPPPVRASVDASTVAYRFNWEWCFDPDNGADAETSWWWARSVRVDPNEVIADDGEGHLWSVPFSTDGTDAITWGAAQRVAETYTPVSASEGAVATAVVQRRRQRALASDLQRPDRGREATPPAPDEGPNNQVAASAAENGRNPMDEAVRQALARQHGLDPESATQDDVNAAVLAANSTAEEDENPVGEAEDQPEGLANAPDPVAASVNSDLRDLLGLPATATAEQVADAARALRDNATAGAQAARTAQASELDGVVDSAVRDGRIAPSARDAWRQAIDPTQVPAAAATTERDRLAAMATNRVPVHERGTLPDPAATANNGSLNRALAAAGINRNGRNNAPTQEVMRRG